MKCPWKQLQHKIKNLLWFGNYTENHWKHHLNIKKSNFKIKSQQCNVVRKPMIAENLHTMKLKRHLTCKILYLRTFLTSAGENSSTSFTTACIQMIHDTWLYADKRNYHFTSFNRSLKNLADLHIAGISFQNLPWNKTQKSLKLMKQYKGLIEELIICWNPFTRILVSEVSR